MYIWFWPTLLMWRAQGHVEVSNMQWPQWQRQWTRCCIRFTRYAKKAFSQVVRLLDPDEYAVTAWLCTLLSVPNARVQVKAKHRSYVLASQALSTILTAAQITLLPPAKKTACSPHMTGALVHTRRAFSSSVINSHQEPVSGQACNPLDPHCFSFPFCGGGALRYSVPKWLLFFNLCGDWFSLPV